MFFSKPPPAKAARLQADQLLRLADKVDAYRRDVLPLDDLKKLRASASALRAVLADRAAPVAALNAANESLHQALLPCGGDIYPVTFSGENVEMLLVAAILAIGVRTFFVMPFKIPTNSMYPTYYGMTPQVYALDAPGPNAAEQTWNYLTYGSTHYRVVAPAAGEIVIPLDGRADSTGQPIVFALAGKAGGRKWYGVLPEQKAVYTLFVGASRAEVRVPVDFNVTPVMLDSYFPELAQRYAKDAAGLYRELYQAGRIRRDARGDAVLYTGRQARAGETILQFDVRTGDMLFVDRFSYHFFPPAAGDPFVFRTDGITDLGQDGQYYIKRLAGEPGDQLTIIPPGLWRNGAAANAVPAFTANAAQQGDYFGYVYAFYRSQNPRYPGPYEYPWSLGPGQTRTVPPATYFALGDNSPASWDSRGWGPVPERNIVGRAVFIVYPFTERWGLAK